VTTAEVQRLGAELGLDAVGVARAEPYAETERHIRERRARGLFGRLRFTTARPEISCHPERLLDGARSVVSAAVCYWLPEPERPATHGRLPRYAWHDGYAELRERLDALGRSLGAPYRVLVDANQHVDREAAARSGVGFYGKNTMLITERHGRGSCSGRSSRPPSWSRRRRSGRGAAPAHAASTPARRARRRAGSDATRCLSY
jgi:epoxyqueuosine reductase